MWVQIAESGTPKMKNALLLATSEKARYKSFALAFQKTFYDKDMNK